MEAEIGRQKIGHNFSKGAAHYEHEALFQKMSAKRLIEHLLQQKNTLVDGPVLEIGCGTGFVTRELLQFLPDREMLITDLSEEMLTTCQRQLKLDRRPIRFEILDGERCSLDSEYALIISGMVFQWFQCPEHSIKRLLQGLRPGGLLIFSCLESSSFPQWSAVCKELGLPFTCNPLPDIDGIVQAVPPHTQVLGTWKEAVTFVYPSAKHFFKSLKIIGASTQVSQKQLKPDEMRRLICHWDDACPLGISVTYQVAYSCWQKDSLLVTAIAQRQIH